MSDSPAASAQPADAPQRGKPAGGAAPKPADPPDRNPLMRMVTVLSAVIGLFVTLNTFLGTCSQQGIERAKARREAVQFEEKYWSDLFARFLNASSSTTLTPDQKRAELMAVTYLSSRQNPSFEEFSRFGLFEDGAEGQRANLEKLRGDLREALRKFAQFNPEIGEDIILLLDDDRNVRERGEASDEAVATPPTVTEAEELATQAIAEAQGPAVATATSQAQLGSSIMATGSTSGWDLDVFWCAGSKGDANYADAVRLGSALATPAEAGTPIAPGFTLGRIRVRSLSESAQATGRYAVRGLSVVYDRNSADERKAGADLQRFLVTQTRVPLQLRGSQGSTPWYMSVFVCAW